MAMTSDAGRNAGSIPELRHKWGWFVALGVLMLIAGAIAMAKPLRWRPSFRCSTSGR